MGDRDQDLENRFIEIRSPTTAETNEFFCPEAPGLLDFVSPLSIKNRMYL